MKNVKAVKNYATTASSFFTAERRACGSAFVRFNKRKAAVPPFFTAFTFFTVPLPVGINSMLLPIVVIHCALNSIADPEVDGVLQ